MGLDQEHATVPISYISVILGSYVIYRWDDLCRNLPIPRLRSGAMHVDDDDRLHTAAGLD